MEYLLKVSMLVGIFYICYKLFLQRETFFEQNRWFLLLGLITSFIIPFLVIPVYVEYTPVEILPNYNFTETPIEIENTKAPFTFLDFLPVVYYAGVVIFTVRFIIQLFSLSAIISRNKKEKIGKYNFIEVRKKIAPFSFFNWIIFNPNDFTKLELEQIITHEKIHVKQKHSIDILLMQLFSIALWFNPFIWLYNKALKQNLEFIADKETQQKFDNNKSYQNTLLKTSLPSHQMALSNPFYNSLIKKRIIMLHKSKSKKINLIKYLLILPLLCLFIMSFNTKEVIKKTPLENSEINNEDHLDIYISKDMSDASLDKAKIDLEKEGYILKIIGIKRNADKYIIAINILVSYKETHLTSFSSNSKSPIKTIKIAINKKDHSISIGNSENHVFNFAYEYANAQLQVGKDPLYVVDGKIITDKGFSLQKKNVKSIDVLKGNKAIEKYGNKGKNGVIEITNKSYLENKLYIKSKSIKTPLYILDGKEATQKEFEMINPDDIKSISVIKNKKAIDKYGDKGENGVIEIITKTHTISMKNGDKINKAIIKKNTTASFSGNAVLNIRASKMGLVYINNIKSTIEEAEKLSPESITSIIFLKDEAAISKYGDKAKKGVIEITTKK